MQRIINKSIILGRTIKTNNTIKNTVMIPVGTMRNIGYIFGIFTAIVLD